MPKIKINDIQLYYEIYGEGEPLILIGGLANPLTDYTQRTKIVAELAKQFKVITFDNRGIGQSDMPDITYSTEMMAEDAYTLLNKLGIKQTNVVGVSMGGRIALALILQHPEMVTKLVLVSTGPKVIKTLRRSLLFTLYKVPFFKNKGSQPVYAFKRQLAASNSYDCTDQLHKIAVPTLIMHGKKDSIAPYTLAKKMHTMIKGSKMVTFEGGHGFLFSPEQKEFVTTVVEFFKK